jgi:PKD repeat protein
MRKNLTHYLKQLATPLLGVGLLAGSAQAQILFDNGPIFNSPGTGAGGANESVLYTTTFAMGTIGFGQQQTAFNRIADDFLATGCSIRIDSVVLFGYQTNSGTTSTFTNVNLRIWNGVPDAVGSTIVFGDTTTNRLIRTAWSGVYRITETTTGNTARPIMRNVLNVGGITVAGGTYWLDWSSAGSSASGPWAPPRTPAGVATTGNGRQRTGSTWNNAVDGGTGNPPQGFPFIIYGAILDPTVDAGADQTACPGSVLTLGGTPAASGGTLPYTYSWSPTTGLSNPNTANPTIVPTGPASYVLTVVDGGGCTVRDTVNVNVGSVPGSFLPNDTTLCNGATITLTATSGVSYLWSTGATTQTITVGPGSYSVVVQDAGGCSATDSIQVALAAPGSVSGDSTVCPGAVAQLTASPAGASYIWSTGDTSQTISVGAAGTYSVTVTVAGCSSGGSFTVSGLAAAVASFSFTNSNLTYNFTDNSTGSPATWAWSFGDGNVSSMQNPMHTYAASGNYTVILEVTNACGTDSMGMNLSVVGIENTLAGSTIEVSPVPATNRFSFDVQGLGTEPLTVDLRDLSGRQIAVWNFENPAAGIRQSVETSAFARGVYMLRFTTSQGSEVRKIVLE